MFHPRCAPAARRRGWLRPIWAFLLLFSPSTAQPASPTRLAEEVARRAGAGGPLIIDASLERAAAAHATEIARDPTKATPSRVRAALAVEGLADALLLPFSALGSDDDALGEAALAFADRARPRSMTHVGLAYARGSGRVALVAILSRRLVTLAPLAKRPRAEPLVVRGRTAARVSIEALALGPCRSTLCLERSVIDLPVTREGELFSFRMPLDRGRGEYTVEIVAELDRGPEIAALWTFAVGGAPRAERDPPAGENDRAALLHSIAGARDRADLGPLDSSDSLDRAAAKHAARVCKDMIAAHVIEGSDPPGRARAEGFSGLVLENVAIASSIAAAHANFMSSPSHRRNVLDPTASEIGVGLAENGKSWCVVELYGR
jgi:uncharacterized protein YkwD